MLLLINVQPIIVVDLNLTIIICIHNILNIKLLYILIFDGCVYKMAYQF